jgi:hypothetical protein
MQILNQHFTTAVGGFLLAIASMAVHAEGVQALGKASVPYSGASAPAAARAKAMEAAELKAIERYYADAGQSEADNFDAIEDKIAANLDRYVLEATVLAEDDNVASQRYTVSVRVELNIPKLRSLVRNNSEVGKSAPDQKSVIVSLFVSREVDSVQSFDDRVYKRVESTAQASGSTSSSKKGSEGESISKSQISTNAAVATRATADGKASASIETGGSTLRKSATTTWKLFPSNGLTSTIDKTFKDAGFGVADAAFAEGSAHGLFHVSSVEDDYRSGNDLKATTLQGVARGMQAALVRYVALGTLDVDKSVTDPQTGLIRVGVTVNAKVLDVSRPIAETVAAVGPVQIFGMGHTEDQARTSALKRAAENAAHELASQITGQGIH